MRTTIVIVNALWISITCTISYAVGAESSLNFKGAAPAMAMDSKRQEVSLPPSRALVFRTEHREVVPFRNMSAEIGLLLESSNRLSDELAQRKSRADANSPELASVAAKLAWIRTYQGRLHEAKKLAETALRIARSGKPADVLGEFEANEILVAIESHDLNASMNVGETTEIISRSLRSIEKAFGAGSLLLIKPLTALAKQQAFMLEFAQARTLLNRADKILGAHYGVKNIELTRSSLVAGEILLSEERYEEALNKYRNALKAFEAISSSSPNDLVDASIGIGKAYLHFDKQDLAEKHFRDSLRTIEQHYGPQHYRITEIIDHIVNAKGISKDHEQLLQRAIGIKEMLLGNDAPALTKNLTDLARYYEEQGKVSLAEAHLLRADRINEKWKVATVGDLKRNISGFYKRQGRFIDAEGFLRQAIEIKKRDKYLREAEIAFADDYRELADLLSRQEKIGDGLKVVRKATSLNMELRKQSISSNDDEDDRLRDFEVHLRLLAQSAERNDRSKIVSESFAVAQQIRGARASKMTAALMANISQKNAGLSRLVRQRLQTEVSINMLLEKSKPADLRETQNRLADLIAERDRLDSKIGRGYPSFASLVEVEHVEIAEVRRLLHDDEALILYEVTEDATYSWVVTNNDAHFLFLRVPAKRIDALALRIRNSLSTENPLTTPFDAESAYSLYREILKPLRPYIENTKNLIIVPSGSLSSLPFNILLTSKPAGELLNLKNYSSMDWVIREFSFATLPAVISLKALRGLPADYPSPPQVSFLGVGDPVFSPDGSDSESYTARDRDSLKVPRRRAGSRMKSLSDLPELPDTAGELLSIAATFGPNESELLLRQDASEEKVKRSNLAKYRILTFATHALMPNEIPGISEAGLVLSPPRKQTKNDDGFLAASEIAQLELRADWVVLSACNTAALEDKARAVGISSLAKAFIFAGARSLLISHWAVFSDATTRLMIDTFGSYRDRPNLGKSNALRQAMLRMIQDADWPEFSHPAFWGPFVVYGEGM
jgi:CHAT domain-containing protein